MDLIYYFRTLFGEYSPIVSTLSDGTETVSINFGDIAYYCLILLAVWGFITILRGVIHNAR